MKSSSKMWSIVGLICAVAGILMVAQVGLSYLQYPTSQYVAAEKAYVDAAAADDAVSMAAAEQTAELQWVEAMGLVGVLAHALFVVALSYGLYVYVRRQKLAGLRAPGLVALMVTLASIVATPLAVFIHGTIIGLDSVQLGVGIVLATAPLTLVVSFITASLAEYLYKRRNSFQA